MGALSKGQDTLQVPTPLSLRRKCIIGWAPLMELGICVGSPGAGGCPRGAGAREAWRCQDSPVAFGAEWSHCSLKLQRHVSTNNHVSLERSPSVTDDRPWLAP